MNAAFSSLRSPRAKRIAWRALWVLVLLLHAPLTLNAVSAFWKLGPGGANRSSLILLAISNAFFILEILFACSLHLLSSRRNLIIFALVVLMLHIGPIEQRLPSAAGSAQGLYALVLVAVGAGEWRRIIRLAKSALAGLGKLNELITRRLTAPHHSHNSRFPIPPRPQSAWRAAPLRAPPQPCL